jgi:hypothetical protein
MTFEQPEKEKVLRVGEKEIRVADPVTVVRSDGTIESDWHLKSFGTGFAVAEKIDVDSGEILVKPIPLEEFLDEQTLQEKLTAKDKEHVSPSGKESHISPETTARRFGIDTKGKTLAQLDAEIREVIRKATGL